MRKKKCELKIHNTEITESFLTQRAYHRITICQQYKNKENTFLVATMSGKTT